MRNLIVILGTSILLLGITLKSNQHQEEVDFIENQLNTNNQIIENLNNLIYSAIKKQVILYPWYKESLIDTDSIRQIISDIKISNQPNFQPLYQQLQKMYIFKHDKQALEYLFVSIDATILQSALLKDELTQSHLSMYETIILNIAAEKCSGTCMGGHRPDLEYFGTKNYCCLGNEFTGKYFVHELGSCGKGDNSFKVTVNGEPIKLKDFTSKIQLKPTSIGKQNYKVTLEGMNSNAEMEYHERTFEYWVRE